MPEKSLQEIPRAWREQYEKGKAAFDRNNLDYAVQILTKVLEQEPGFYDCREALRATQFRRTGGGCPGFFKKLVGSTNPKVVQAQVAVRKDPLHALRLAEQALNSDPNNQAAHKVLADAALAADLPRTAALSLEIVFKQNTKDRNIALKLAQTLPMIGRVARAESVMEDLAQHYPHDPEISQALKNVTAKRTMSEGGYEKLGDGEGSYRDIIKDEKEAVQLEREQKEGRSGEAIDELLAEYEKRLTDRPTDLRLMRTLAELCVEKKDFDRALQYYERLTGGEAPDAALERIISETRARKFDHAITQLDPNTPDHAKRMAAIEAEKQEYLLQACLERVERYPNDLEFKFELGQLYAEAGRLSEAIQQFQKARNNPHLRIQALFRLGQCFSQRGMHDLAVRTLENAIREKPLFDEEKKALVYALAEALEQTGKQGEAIEQFKQIYEVDIGYRDVAARVDAFYAAQADG